MLSGKKRTMENMSHGFFSGISILFSGLPAVRVKIFSKIIETNGGTVIKIEKKAHSLQSAKTHILDASLNYIVVDKPLCVLDLCSKLHCDNIPSSVQVVQCTWLEQCASQKCLLDSAEYTALEVIPQNQGACTLEVKMASQQQQQQHHPSSSCSSSNSGISGCEGSGDSGSSGGSSGNISSSKSSCSRSNAGKSNKSGTLTSADMVAPVSVSSCAGIILKHQDRIFMVQPTGSKGWGIPKGGVEPEESLETAARREFLEETGIVLSACVSCSRGETRSVTQRKRSVDEKDAAEKEEDVLLSEQGGGSSGARGAREEDRVDHGGDSGSSGKIEDISQATATNSSCDCTHQRTPISLAYLVGSGEDIRGGKKIHAFVCNGHGEETYLCSNLIDRGFRKGLPENCAGRYMSIEDALHKNGGLVHKNQRKLIEIYAAAYC